MGSLVLSRNETARSPYFWLGVVLKLVAIFFVLPAAAHNWYVPFLEHLVHNPNFDPWGSFLSSQGDSLSFPYGTMQIVAFYPIMFFTSVLGIGGYWGYSLTLFMTDLGLLYILKELTKFPIKALLKTYWLSPIVIVATYWFGMNDLLCILMLCLAFLTLNKEKILLAAVFSAFAVSMKLSMLIALPFIVFYLFRNHKYREDLVRFLIVFTGVSLIVWLPFLLSPAARFMLFSNPEINKIYALHVQVQAGSVLYVLPLVYILILYNFWAIRRISFNLLFIVSGICFFVVLLLTPAASGWFIWAVPLLVIHQIRDGRKALMLVWVFTLLYILVNVPITPQAHIAGSNIASELAEQLKALVGPHVLGILNTLMLGTGFVILMRIWKSSVQRDNFFRISRRPLVIGIAGDSGVGKDRLAERLMGLFGTSSVAHITGDDYHNWDRSKPMWSVVTHLNPMANNIEAFSRDVGSIVDGKSVFIPHYNHLSGKMTKPRHIRSNGVILVSGLHTFHTPALRDHIDVRIFVDMDEDLRRFFKVSRDVAERGHALEKVLASMESRQTDSLRFIRNQQKYADLRVQVLPVNKIDLDHQDESNLRLKLIVTSELCLQETSLIRELVGFCGLHVDIENANGEKPGSLMVEGDVESEDIAYCAKRLFPDLIEFLDKKPRWVGGMEGVLQLIVFVHIKQAYLKRLIV